MSKTLYASQPWVGDYISTLMYGGNHILTSQDIKIEDGIVTAFLKHDFSEYETIRFPEDVTEINIQGDDPEAFKFKANRVILPSNLQHLHSSLSNKSTDDKHQVIQIEEIIFTDTNSVSGSILNINTLKKIIFSPYQLGISDSALIQNNKNLNIVIIPSVRIKTIYLTAFQDNGNDFRILGYPGTEAEKFAQKRNIPFCALKGDINSIKEDIEKLNLYSTTDVYILKEGVDIEVSDGEVVNLLKHDYKQYNAIAFPEGITGIDLVGNGEYGQSLNAKKVIFPSTLENIYKFSFSNGSPEGEQEVENIQVEEFVLSEGLGMSKGRNLFVYNHALKTVNIPSNWRGIFENFCYGCTNLEKVVIPTTVTAIKEGAFAGCDNLTIYGYAGSAAETYADDNDIPFVNIGSDYTKEISAINEELVGKKTPEGGEIFNDYENNIAEAEFTHVEGHKNKIITDDREHSAVWSHAEGDGNTIEGANSGAHAEGAANILKANIGHVEGALNEVSKEAEVSHTEGAKNKNRGRYSHIEGRENIANPAPDQETGKFNFESVGGEHVEGWGNIAKGRAAHVEGCQNQALANDVHVEGSGTISTEATQDNSTKGQAQHVQGKYNIQDTEGKYAHIVGNGTRFEVDGQIIENRSNAHTLDWEGNAWFAGEVKVGKEQLSLATQRSLEEVRKKLTTTSNNMVGRKTPEGGEVFNKATNASADGSHAEGVGTEAGGTAGTHTEGYHTKATDGYGTHAEGFFSEALASTSHAEGARTKTKKSKELPGLGSSYGTHAEGYGTIAVGTGQHAAGTYNIEDTESKYLHILGNGTKEDEYDDEGNLIKQNRSNAHTIDRDGNAWFGGDIAFTYEGNEYNSLGETLTTQANAIELLTNGVSADEVDSVNDLIEYVNEHGSETTQMQKDIAANKTEISNHTKQISSLEENLVAKVDKIEGKSLSSNDYTNKDKQAVTTMNNTFTNALIGKASGEAVVISDISPVEHDMDVKVSSKNLFSFNQIDVKISANVEYTVSEDGNSIEFSRKSANQNASLYFKLGSFKDYIGKTFTSKIINDNAVAFDGVIYWMDSTRTQKSIISDISGGQIGEKINTFTIPELDKDGDLYLALLVSGAVAGTKYTLSNIQIEEGTAATDYTSYVNVENTKIKTCGKNLFDVNTEYTSPSDRAIASVQDNVLKVATKANGSEYIFVRADNITSFNAFTNKKMYISAKVTWSSEERKTKPGIMLMGSHPSLEKPVNLLTIYADENGIIDVVKEVSKDTLSKYNTLTLQFYYHAAKNSPGIEGDYVEFSDIMISATDIPYEPYQGGNEYTPSADGTVEGVASIYPHTTILSDTPNVLIETEYNRDINKAFAELQNALISLGGNI